MTCNGCYELILKEEFYYCKKYDKVVYNPDNAGCNVNGNKLEIMAQNALELKLEGVYREVVL